MEKKKEIHISYFSQSEKLSKSVSLNTHSREVIEKLSDWEEAKKIRDFVKTIRRNDTSEHDHQYRRRY